MQTVIGAFDSQDQAQRAMDRLVKEGFDRNEIHIEKGDPTPKPVTTSSKSTDEKKEGGIGHFFSSLFGTDTSEEHQHYAETYEEAVRRGACVVVLDAKNDAEADKAALLLHEAGALNVDERMQQWRGEGWTGGQPRAAQPAMQAQGRPAQPAMQQPQARQGTAPLGNEGTLEVVEEQMQVGKQNIARGGVRIVQRVTEKPVREVVRLREEHAVVERRPVDRPLRAGEMEAFREGEMEINEMAEQPVVGKTARVVEEVRVGKQVEEREQVVEGKVRRKDVDVQRVGGERERERAAASERSEQPSTSRDPDAPNPTRKNNPST